MDIHEIKKTLAGCEFFSGFAAEDIERVAALCHPMSLDPGPPLFIQGKPGENIYIVAEGLIRLERDVNLGARKGTVAIETLGKNRVLGCWATLLSEPHILMSSAICQKTSTVLVMKGKDLREMMLEDSVFGFKVLERFCFLLKDRIQAIYGALERI